MNGSSPLADGSAPLAQGMSRLAMHLGALVVAAAGTALVFAAMVIMNDEVTHAPPHARAVELALEPVRPKVPPKAPPRPPPKAERRQADKVDARIAPPVVSTNLAGVDLGLPELGVAADVARAADLAGPGKDAEALVMSEGAVDSPPRAVERTPPSYPARARAEGVEGVVTVSLLVAADGSVERAKVVAAEPPGVFDAAALDAVRAWRFEPASYGGKPVKVWARQVVRFGLM